MTEANWSQLIEGLTGLGVLVVSFGVFPLIIYVICKYDK